MGLLEDCLKYFGTKNLYEVLEVSQTANEKVLKKAYYKTSMKVHPDRVLEEEKKISTMKFQILGKLYSLLSDKDRRAVYDESGEVNEEDQEEVKDWAQHWRLHFRKIGLADIGGYAEKFRGSKKELTELKQAYIDGEGCMTYIIEHVSHARYEDEARFTEIINGWISKKKVEAFPKFTNETARSKNKRKRKFEKEEAEAEELRRELGLDGGEESLRQMITKRTQEFTAQSGEFFDYLAEKYGKKKKK